MKCILPCKCIAESDKSGLLIIVSGVHQQMHSSGIHVHGECQLIIHEHSDVVAQQVQEIIELETVK